ncbi:MAG: hypothetical protein WCK10_00100 [Candidatus Staskawiczbacteria bacterium]
MFKEGENRDSREDQPIESPIEPQQMSPEEARGPFIEVESNTEENAEKTVEEAVNNIEFKDGGDPIISLDWIKDGKKWMKEKKEAASAYIEDKKKKYDEWAKENPKTASAIGVTTSAARVGFVLAFKIAWGLIKFSYEAIKNKGKVSDAYKIGKEMFSFDEKGGKK